jgi:cytochrome c oxidase assembly protein subunit 15
MGWFMVMSGLVDRPDVSQYRLTAHFGLALLIIIALLWVALGLLNKDPHDQSHQDAGALSCASKGLFGLAFVTALSGGFVAGLDAGFAYNTFPLMDDSLIPGGLFDFDPWFMAPFEDITTIQFNHRVLAELTFVVAMIVWFKSKSKFLAPRTRMAVNALGIMACVQVALGISTLVLVVPVVLGSLHQVGAVLLLSIATWCMHELRAPKAEAT